MATRDVIIEVEPNIEFIILWSRIDYEFEENEEIIIVWNDNDEYRK